jgi:hypothetical protein
LDRTFTHVIDGCQRVEGLEPPVSRCDIVQPFQLGTTVKAASGLVRWSCEHHVPIAIFWIETEHGAYT